MTWKEARGSASACYAVSYSLKPFSKQDSWFALAPAEDRKVYERWLDLACCRMTQAGEFCLVQVWAWMYNQENCPRSSTVFLVFHLVPVISLDVMCGSPLLLKMTLGALSVKI